MPRAAPVSAIALLLAACATGSAVDQAKPVAAPAAVPAAPSAADIAAETARLNAWFDKKYEEQLAFSPIALTFLGRKEHYGEIDDFSEAEQLRQLEWQKASVAELEASFDYRRLDREAQTSYDLWKYQYELAAAGLPFLDNGYAFTQFQGNHTFLATFLINFHQVDSEADMLAYIARLGAGARALDQLVVRAQKSAQRGIRPPRFAFDAVIDESRKLITGAPFGKGKDASLWADAQAKIDALVKNGTISAARGKELKSAAKQALLTQIKPAYERLIAWEKQDRVHAPVNPTGVGGTQADGKAYYEYQLKTSTTTDLSAEQIHAIGLSEVARLRGEMEAIKDRVGFKGDLQSFFKYVKTDPRFFFSNDDAGRQAYIDAATAAIDNIKKDLPQYFGILPKADLVVKRVEPFREQAGAAQHYYPGTPDGSRPGVYYAHLLDMRAMPKPELEVIAYHEGIPGHHMQISIAQELKSVPLFRTQANFNAYAEGWGLYAEWLAKEMPGTYQDPYSDFGRLGSEMWRAVRLVVDTGLHAKGWTEEQAIAYFAANTAAPAAQMRSEVRRYLVAPGQATGYKIGMIKIQELRRKAETQLGAKFDIRGFHDTVLGGGGLPLPLLERRVDQWIAAQQG